MSRRVIDIGATVARIESPTESRRTRRIASHQNFLYAVTMKLEAADLLAMDDGQKVAVLEALVTGVLADGKVTPNEIRRFDEVVLALPWGMDEPVLTALVKGTQQRVLALKSATDVQDFVANLAARLPSPELRDKVVFTMATVMAADNEVNQLERNVIGLFVLAFGITSERSAAIKAAVAGHVIALRDAEQPPN
jgi:uncharacterized tellurite resistance protein B-like protein